MKKVAIIGAGAAGVICGIRVENMEDSVMKEIRYLDKMVDELAKGKTLEKVFRQKQK